MKNSKLKKFLIIGIPLFFALIIGIFFSSKIGFSLLSGNSVVGEYYYCDDSTYTLSGAKCRKTLYTSPYLVGDVDHDGTIGIMDVTYIQLYLAGNKKFDEFDTRLADVNKDGIIDNNDASIIQKYSIGIVDETTTYIHGSSGVVLEQSYILGTDKLCPINYNYSKVRDNCVMYDRKDAIKVNFIYGDINENKKIDDEDYALIKSYLSGSIKLTDKQLKIADMNSDGKVSMEDLQLIENEIIGSSNKDENLKNDKSKNTNDYINGDINEDKKIDSEDYALIKSYLASGFKLTDRQLKIADMNSDGKVSMEDLQLIESKVINSDKTNVTLKIADSNDVNNLFIGDDVSFSALFKVSGNSKKYYKWYNVKSENSIVESSCKVIENNMVDNYKINLETSGQYIIVKVFDSAKCENMIDEYKSNILNAKEKSSAVSLEYNVENIDNKVTILSKNTRVDIKSKFNVVGNNKLYYKLVEYKDNKVVNTSKCFLIENGIEEKKSIYISGSNQYLKWVIYSDKACNTQINSYETEKYNSIDGFKIYADTNKIVTGDKLKLSVKSGSNLKELNDLVIWNSTNTSIAVVDKNGVVTALKEGSTMITAKIGNITNSIAINVVNEKVNLQYQLLSKSLTSNVVDKNTSLSFNAKFEINDGKKYYYKWYTIKNKLVYNNPVCIEINDGMNLNSKLIIDGSDQYGKWEIYSDKACTQIINSYETTHYDYYADSISLDKSKINLAVNEKYKTNVQIKSKLSNPKSLVKWTSSNVAVATVDNNGLVSTKKAGTATITASIGGMSDSATVNVINAGEDRTLNCPLIEYELIDSKTTIIITPNSDIKNYDIYFSTNDHVGTYGTFELFQKNITGRRIVTNYFKNKYSNQAKIVVYGNSGSSRNCYTPPLTWKWYTGTNWAKCPTFKYNYDKKSGASQLSYKVNNQKVKSGIEKIYVNFDLDNSFQYSWYTSNKDGSYRLFKTYSTSSKDVSPSVTGQNYNRNGQVVVTDPIGNAIVCKTEYINTLSMYKTKVGTTDVYYDSQFPTADKNTVINEMTKLKNKSEAYLAASSVFLYSESNYVSMHGNSCGVYEIASNNIDMRESKYACGGSANSTYYKGSINHEFGHSMDHMTENLAGVSLSNSKYNNKLLKTYADKYNRNKKQCNYDYCLRYNEGYTYGDAYWEFLADLLSYDSNNFRVNSELRSLNSQLHTLYMNTYNKNKDKFRQVKESYK